ncbi:anaerobic ribonucleoside-triphosphate reductase activating protein [Lacrimispora saccharolytica]|uniref:Anaerobic ribonucleoside-triphosphate reductase-activating protein n=1 Tax=Lacrimispora saccharolytica (strain ATCC 35040 / DSM 2544 / NRCC 2533 / WM1) TaxID=610130 RepID=D9R3E0_LACSW|nr:anaerobic ribonucleoside-triphosphate reductase activating protein [Lacrimispora saccharolytica]ADL04889.1 anaerobic ribonucleoside-triphosphate reductase activating protein [[Clostridium] saccharolyticum WM1]QRV20902.1 anaerobic ribonucleoside-triphosphate reductase activating protein [Lacrimispora saccharolytica]
MNYATIKPTDVANGPGVRVSLFVSGCNHRCRECFNSEAWDFHYGKEYGPETLLKILEYLDHTYIAGLSLLGGEPMDPANQKGILSLVEKVKERFPEKTIWCYTGYDFKRDILEDMAEKLAETKRILACLDVLVDGRFEVDKKDLKLRFRGSSNQRIIKVQESLATGTIVLWE